MPPPGYWHLLNPYFKFDPDWLIQVIEETAIDTPYLQEHPEMVAFLKEKIPSCNVLRAGKNTECANNINFYFVDSTNPNAPGSDWQYKKSIKIEARGADLIFDILTDDRIGMLEVWVHPFG